MSSGFYSQNGRYCNFETVGSCTFRQSGTTAIEWAVEAALAQPLRQTSQSQPPSQYLLPKRISHPQVCLSSSLNLHREVCLTVRSLL